MNAPLALADIDESVRQKVYTQEYGAKAAIAGVAFLPVKHVVTEDGDFSEVMRLPENGAFADLPGFVVRQVSRSLLYPHAVKGWHLHLSQDELWYVPAESHLIIGLWDVRGASKTKGVNQKVAMGGGKEVLLFIPHGVAHGCSNVSNKPATVIYFANAVFNKEAPDEQRIPYDALGADFWQAKKD